MVLYNVTIKVEHAIANEWLEWMKAEHIPQMKATGCFYDASIYKLMETDESDGITYAVQYHCADYESYKEYLAHYSTEMRKRGTDKWQNKFVAFRSVLQLVH